AALEAITRKIASDEHELSQALAAASAAATEARNALSSLESPTVEATAARVGSLQERIRELHAARDQARVRATAAEQVCADLEPIRAERDRLIRRRDEARTAYEAAQGATDKANKRFERLRTLMDEVVRTAKAADSARVRRTAAATDL